MAKALRTVESREGSQVMCYIDDVIIATETVEDHLVRLREVFECLRKSKPEVQVSQVFLHEASNQVLGTDHHQGWSASGSRSSRESPEMATAAESDRTCQFLGFANYYKEFVKDFATKAFEMSSLMRKAAPLSGPMRSSRIL